MNENGYNNNQQYDNGYDQQYGGQQYNNGYDQQYGGQQYNNGYNNTPKVYVSLPEGMMNHLPESWKNNIEDISMMSVQNSSNPYERLPVKNVSAFINPIFAIIAMCSLVAGCVAMKLGNSGAFVFFVGVMCIFIGIGIMIDGRTVLKKHMRSCVFLVFGIEVILASGYQMLAREIPSLQAMNGRVLGMVSGVIIGSIGPLLLIFHYLNYYFRKKTYTEEVQAVCVYLQRRLMRAGNAIPINEYAFRGSSGNSGIKLIPVYEYTFRGKNFCVADSNSKQITSSTTTMGVRTVKTYGLPMVGGTYELMVNPDDPKDFYSKINAPCISVWVLAVVAIAIGCLFFKSTVSG